MAEADFLVLPSVTVEEMFGLVVIEAMAASRPVVTTALPSGVREVNVSGETGLEVPLRDVDALAAPWTPWPTIPLCGPGWEKRDGFEPSGFSAGGGWCRSIWHFTSGWWRPAGPRNRCLEAWQKL